ncbi:MAG: NAD(P)-dependent oxidoreductase [Vicinamibacteria bacterium]
MRILITGAGGLVGGRLCGLLDGNHSIVGTIRNQQAPAGVASVRLELSDPSAVDALLRSACPDVVVHCAALADPEICERDPERARLDNEVATGIVARACGRLGARLITLSTDLVLDGETAWSTESVRPGPISEYGRSKLAAELAALSDCPGAVIFRTALVVGRGYGARLTATESIASRLQRGETVTLYEDEWRTPIDPDSIAQAVNAVIDRPGASGVFNLAGSERLTRMDLGLRVARVLGLNASLLQPSPRTAHRGPPRTRDASLDTRRANKELNWTARPLDAAIREGRGTS